VYIDYSSVEKPNGEHETASSPIAGANVVVLSADPVLIDLLRDSLAGNHRVWRADDATHAADLIVAAGNAVLLADSSLADQDTRELVTKVHEQFPDLPIIVAGRRDDEASLSDLVSEGTIFRFLHKPASADRIRNFVEATLRRMQKAGDGQAAAVRTGATSVKLKALTMPAIRLDSAGVRRWTRRSLLLIPLVLIVALLATWKPWETIGDMLPDAGEAQRAAVEASRDSAVQKLLESASFALSQGQLVEPPGQNALELYRAVLARDPDNRIAGRGIDKIADDFLAQAETALMAQDLDALASAVDAARAARPDHPRLEFFSTQLERERERLGQAGTVLRPAVSASAARPAPSSTQASGPQPAPVPAPVSAPSDASRVQGFVLLAKERMRSNQLVGGKDSAHAYLLAAKRLDPAGADVQQGIAALAALLQTNARKAMSEGRLDDANEWLHQAVALDVNRPEVAELRSELEVARLGTQREDRLRLFTLANQRIAQGHLIEPMADSARHYLDLLRASDPAYQGLPETNALLAAKTLAEARRLADAGNVNGADAMLKAAAESGAQATDLAAVSDQIQIARAAIPPPKPPAPVVLPENEMHRTFFVNPVYPARALERGTTGWVDIEFTVSRDGSTKDASVRGSEPMGVFDRAALESVARWRYEPRVVNGVVVDQRVAARVRFELKN
jgi:TonB family protein